MGSMRVTVTLDPDIALAVRRAHREEGTGASESLNRLARRGLATMAYGSESRTERYVHTAIDMGIKVDVANVGEVDTREWSDRRRTARPDFSR